MSDRCFVFVMFCVFLAIKSVWGTKAGHVVIGPLFWFWLNNEIIIRTSLGLSHTVTLTHSHTHTHTRCLGWIIKSSSHTHTHTQSLTYSLCAHSWCTLSLTSHPPNFNRPYPHRLSTALAWMNINLGILSHTMSHTHMPDGWHWYVTKAIWLTSPVVMKTPNSLSLSLPCVLKWRAQCAWILSFVSETLYSGRVTHL